MRKSLTLGRRLLAAFAIVACGADPVMAQQPETGVSPLSIERISAALQAQQPAALDGVGLFGPTRSDRSDSAFFTPSTADHQFPDRLLEHPVIFRLGVFSFVTPSAGLFVDVRVPIGEILTHAGRSVAAAQRRRTEKAAHAEVVKALAEFQAAQSK